MKIQGINTFAITHEKKKVTFWTKQFCGYSFATQFWPRYKNNKLYELQQQQQKQQQQNLSYYWPDLDQILKLGSVINNNNNNNNNSNNNNYNILYITDLILTKL